MGDGCQDQERIEWMVQTQTLRSDKLSTRVHNSSGKFVIVRVAIQERMHARHVSAVAAQSRGPARATCGLTGPGRAVVDVYVGCWSPCLERLTGMQATTDVVNNAGQKPCCEVLAYAVLLKMCDMSTKTERNYGEQLCIYA
jgi:hypothetical protein